MESIIQQTVGALTNYYSDLQAAATPTARMEEDMRTFYSDPDLYYNVNGDDARMKAFYFDREIYAPLCRVFNILQGNAGISVSAANLPGDFRLSHSEAATLLTTKFTRCRGLILDQIHCSSSDFENVKNGIMEADGEALQKVSLDMTDHYMLLEFANRVSQVYPCSSDDVIAAVYRPVVEMPMPDIYCDVLPFEETRAKAKRIIVDFWADIDKYSTREIEVVEGVIKSDIFRPFREDCAVLFQRETGLRPQRPHKKLPTSMQTTAATPQKEAITGVRELKDYLHVGLAKAQEILNSGILQKAGISYRAGNRHIIDKEKLDDFIKNNPDAFAKLSKKG